MANLNLSQFGENTSVSNADYTFVWDSANAISKKVSRNSWLNSGTLTSDAPVTISQTWNAGSNVMTALKVVATDTASGATSNLLELWAGSTPILKFNVSKNGVVAFRSANIFGDIATDGLGRVLINASSGNGIRITGDVHIGSNDTILLRDGAANTLALRNGANTQTFNVYGSYGSISDYKRLSISCDQTTGNATITNQAAGYTAGTVSINGVPVGLGKGNVATNVAVGTGALNANVTGANNTIIGKDALLNSTAGTWNVIIGSSASKATLGVNNYTTVVGAQAMENCVTSSYNSAFGQGAGYFISTGGNLTSSQNSVFFGALSRPLGNGETNQIVIGYESIGIGSNSVVLGNDSITKTALKGNVGIGTTAPTDKLEVSGNSGPTQIRISCVSPGTAANLQLAGQTFGQVNNAVGPLYITNGAADSIIFRTATDTKAIISASGNLGIGTTSPTSKLHVASGATNIFQAGTNAGVPYIGVGDTAIYSDALDSLEMRRVSSAAQTIKLYGTYTASPLAYERLTISAPSSGNAIIGTNKTGTGAIARGLEFQTDGVTRLTIQATTGAASFSSDITPGANRYIRFINNTAIHTTDVGVLNVLDVGGFNVNARITLGGSTSSFPALKRSTTSLQARLADDSAFTNIQGKLTTDTAFDATVVTPTGFITLYDSTGTAYKVPCVPA